MIAYMSFKKQTDSTAFQILVAQAALKIDTEAGHHIFAGAT